MSVSLAIAPLEWGDRKINLVDTPGYADFFGEVAEASRVVDGAIVLLDGVAGIQVGTDAVWKKLDELELPRLIFVNKMDRENADFGRVVGQLRERYGKRVVPLTVPVGSEHDFAGVVELVSRQAHL